MICRSVNVASFAILAFGVTSVVHAQAIATYDENSSPFLVGSYDAPGVVTPTSESIFIDVPSDDDTFGIAGTLHFPPVDFAPDEYLWELRFRILAGNETPVLDTIYSDQDEGVAIDEGWVFRFDLSPYTPADDWVVLRQGFDNPLVPGTDDGVQNPGLVLIGLLREPGTDTRFHIELDYLTIIPIPEPAAPSLLGFAAACVLCTRRTGRSAGR